MALPEEVRIVLRADSVLSLIRSMMVVRFLNLVL
jgi:hypothetical protein